MDVVFIEFRACVQQVALCMGLPWKYLVSQLLLTRQ